MARVEIPVEAKLNAGDIDAELKQLTQKINSLGASIAQANKVKFNPIGKATLDDLKRVQTEFDKLKRTSPLGSDINRTGQGSKSFFDLDWNSISANGVSREARRYGAFNRIMAGTGASFTQNAPASSPGGGGGGNRASSPGGGGSAWANAGRKIVGSGLKAAGPVGGVADEAVGAGMSGGVMAGVAGLIGGVVALGVGKLVGGVMSKIGDAQNDAIGYDTLKRSLGDVNVSFSVLQRSMHAASDAFDGTYQQALKMGGEFARISGMSGKAGSESLAQEVAVGGGFGRSFGIDPDQSNTFFAKMAQFQVTGNVRDSQRLANYIGEAIEKSGSASKADEMLQVIASYTEQQTRMGLATANQGDYTAELAGMVGSKIPGLDPMGSAAILSRVNSAVASGGNAGEAGQNFTYSAIGKPLGLDPIQASILREQGAFGTGEQAFGDKSVYRQFASKYNLSTPGVAASSGETNFQALMSQFHGTYKGKPELMLDAMSNYFGVNHSQAMALDLIKPEHLGALQSALDANHIDISKLAPTSIQALSTIASGTRDQLGGAATDIRGKLSSAETASLDKAGKSGNIEDLRGELLKDYAKYGQADTEGSQTRDAIQNLDKSMTDAAGKMITPLNVMRDTLLYAFGKRGDGVMTPDDIHKAVIDGQKKDINETAAERINKARDAYTNLTVGLRGAPDAPLEKRIRAAADNWKSEGGAANWEKWTALTKLDADNAPPVERSQGSSAATPSWMNGGASASQGSGGGYDPIGGGGGGSPRNLRDNNPGNIKYNEWAKAHGATGSEGGFAIFPNAQVGTSATDALLSSYAKNDHLNTVSGIVSKWAPSKDGNNTAAYIANVSKRLRVDPNASLNMDDPSVRQALGREIARQEGSVNAYQFGTPMPDTGSRSSAAGPGGTQSYSFDHTHTITLQYPNGQPAASPFSINTNVAAAAPHGT